MQNPKKYLDPKVLARLTRLDLKARLVVEGFLSGLHQSPYKGFSQEFADYRQYMPGDEIRRIDWKVYGRSDRFYIKEYLEETNLRGYILLDKSGSMGYGEGVTKLEYSKYLAASLAYLLYRQKDGVGIVTFDVRIRDFIPPSSKKLGFMRSLEAVDSCRAGGETSLADVLFELAQKIKRRGLVILISDLLDEPERVLKALRSFKHRKHEILVFQVLDARERTFPFTETALFYDLETGEEMAVQPDFIRQSFQKKMGQFLDHYRHQLREARITYDTLYTDTPYDKALFSCLQKRSRLL
jgi:uncharacterized protein (DUF58 family)